MKQETIDETIKFLSDIADEMIGHQRYGYYEIPGDYADKIGRAIKEVLSTVS